MWKNVVWLHSHHKLSAARGRSGELACAANTPVPAHVPQDQVVWESLSEKLVAPVFKLYIIKLRNQHNLQKYPK